MTNFQVPTREEVSPANQAIFDKLQKQVGFLPNLFATYAYSENGLKNHLESSAAKTSLSKREIEVVNLAVSQVNECLYCLSAHTAIAKMNGFNEDQILEIRRAEVTFDPKLDALAKLAKDATENRGKTTPKVVEQFLAGGYNKENLVDTIIAIGEKIKSNYLHNTTNVPVDFPLAPALETAAI